MKNIFRFLSRHIGAVIAILLLLVVQAYCELALPGYTSDLLNVGLQQGGIEDAVLKTVRQDSLATLELFMPQSDVEVIEQAYEEPDEQGIRALSGDADTAAVNGILLMPECMVYQMSENPEISLEQIEQNEQLLAQMEETIAGMGDVPDTYLNQIATSYVTQEYEAQGVDMDALRSGYLWSVGGKMLFVSLIMLAASALVGLLAAVTSAKVGQNLREGIYGKVMSFTNAEMERFSTASLITRSTNDIQQIQMVVVMLLRMVAYAPILAIGGILKVMDTGSEMSWIIVLAVVVLSASVGILMGIAYPKFKKMQSLVDRLNLVSRELLTGIMPIRAFSREKHEEQRFDKANRDLYETQLFTNRAMAFMMPIMMFVMNAISVLIVWVGAKYVDLGTVQVGDLTAFITYAMVIVMSFLIISFVAIMLPRAGVAADRIVEVLDMEVTLKDADEVEDEKVANAAGKITFSDVSFKYPGADECAVEHISFTAEPGRTTAIIGSTGCGKSTVLNLIPRFYDVTEGAVLLDDVDIRKISQKRLRELLGYVPQKGMLFSGTVETNLKYAGEDITDEDMKEAAAIAQAEEFISSKPKGYDTVIAQSGTNVSGGQRQRLAIARAIAKHPKVFLFDDSFSALDYKTDLALRNALAEKTKDATVIIVAQRIATILHADQIVVLDDGKIAGIGTHSELLRTCKTYQEIASSQLSEAELSESMEGGAV